MIQRAKRGQGNRGDIGASNGAHSRIKLERGFWSVVTAVAQGFPYYV
jgi:hypothetical protein